MVCCQVFNTTEESNFKMKSCKETTVTISNVTNINEDININDL